jgi:hypothetical protein
MYFDWHVWLGTGASILLLALIVPYIRSVTSSTTRPSAVSLLGWSLLASIAAAAQASKGIGWSLMVPIVSAVSSAIIAIAVVRSGRTMRTRADLFSIMLGAAAIVLWVITKEPLSAIVLSIIADFAAALPTLVKTYVHPKSEPAVIWLLYALGVALEIAATREFTLYSLLFPVYSVCVCSSIALLALSSKNTSHSL